MGRKILLAMDKRNFAVGTEPISEIDRFSQDEPSLVRRAFGSFDVFPTNSTRVITRRVVSEFAVRLSAWGITKLGDISGSHIQAFLDERRQIVTERTVASEYAALRRWFEFLFQDSILTNNPINTVTPVRYSHKVVKTPALSNAEAMSLLNSIETDTLIGMRDRAIIALLLFTGCTARAVFDLNVGDFREDRSIWQITLSGTLGTERTIPLHHVATGALLDWVRAAGLEMQPNTPVFRTMPLRVQGKTQPYTEQALCVPTIGKVVKGRLKKAGLERQFSCASLRVTAITKLLDNGAMHEDVQGLVGLAHRSSVDMYIRRSHKSCTPAELVERIDYGSTAGPQAAPL